MTDAVEIAGATAVADKKRPYPLAIFATWRLRAYGYTIAAVYAALLVYLYSAGLWLSNGRGAPVYSDFILPWLAGVQALDGQAATVYDSAELLRLQQALVGPRDYFYPNWPYPPTFFFFLIPFALLPYVHAFIAWQATTLLGCIAVVYRIVPRSPTIALALASPFTAWVLFTGQNSFLWALLLGAALYFLERRAVLAGIFIGCLTYKPQFGILLPVALVAAQQWRALASAAATAVLMILASVAAFGTAVWETFPEKLAAQTSEVLISGGHGSSQPPDWGQIQTIYGLIRYLEGGAALAWLAQGLTAAGLVVIVWVVWRSPARYPLKAAMLSAAALCTTPYAFATDLAAVVIPIAFLASDQIRCGVLRGEQSILIILFGAALLILLSLGHIPLGPPAILMLVGIILRRIFRPPLGVRAAAAFYA